MSLFQSKSLACCYHCSDYLLWSTSLPKDLSSRFRFGLALAVGDCYCYHGLVASPCCAARLSMFQLLYFGVPTLKSPSITHVYHRNGVYGWIHWCLPGLARSSPMTHRQQCLCNGYCACLVTSRRIPHLHDRISRNVGLVKLFGIKTRLPIYYAVGLVLLGLYLLGVLPKSFQVLFWWCYVSDVWFCFLQGCNLAFAEAARKTNQDLLRQLPLLYAWP